MTINQTWTDPSEAGTIDLDTNDILTDTVWDALVSDVARIGGTAGPPNVQAARGAFPVSGYVMGALGNDRHVESGNGSANSSGNLVVTFANAYASAPNVIAVPNSTLSRNSSVDTITTTGCNVNRWIPGTGPEAGTVHWVAEGAD